MRAFRFSLLFLVLFLPLSFGIAYKMLAFEKSTALQPVAVGVVNSNGELVQKSEKVFTGRQLGWPFAYTFVPDDVAVASRTSPVYIAANVLFAVISSLVISLLASTLLKKRQPVAG